MDGFFKKPVQKWCNFGCIYFEKGDLYFEKGDLYFENTCIQIIPKDIDSVSKRQ